MAQHKPNMDGSPAPPSGSAWSSREAYLLALICLFSGLALGYLFRGSSSPGTGLATGSVNEATVSAADGFHVPDGTRTGASPESLPLLAGPLLKALDLDPKNGNALVQLGNLYYDHQAYSDATRYYERALELRPDDVNVRTDLGTAYWYAGFPEKAVQHYQKALAVRDDYPQTLLNLGIVRLDGLKDAAGAIAAWEKLLEKNPQFHERQRVLDLIARARSQKGQSN